MWFTRISTLRGRNAVIIERKKTLEQENDACRPMKSRAQLTIHSFHIKYLAGVCTGISYLKRRPENEPHPSLDDER
jgi:hypothetical protein